MKAKSFFLLFLFIYVLKFYYAYIHTNQFAVKINEPHETVDLIAKKYGFINRGQIGSLKGYYLFESHGIEKRSINPSTVHAELLENDAKVQWSEQQIIKTRVKRSATAKNLTFTDPLYPEQWFLHDGAYGGYDMNVVPAWKLGYTGKNIVVSILDDGIQGNHPDLAVNYDKDASWDINDCDSDPSPQDNNDNKHGTRCAGEVAAVANNEFCGIGVAYNAKIGGVRMLDGSVTDSIEATALSLHPNHIQIYSASWGPEDDGKTVDGPGYLAKVAFEEGIKKGRNGLGSIFVWASGNGGKLGDNCNCDGYTNSIYTISISSAAQSGTKPWYLEECSSTIATTYSSGTSSSDKNIITVDVNYNYLKELKHGKPNESNLCTKSHTGTSASAPIAAGLCALALEANFNLTWRDMQYIIVLTSRYKPLRKEDGWITNGIGHKVSTKFGYGLMDADAMVRMAAIWKTVGPQHICSIADTTERLIPSGHKEQVEAALESDGCQNTDNVVKYIEHVQVRITLVFQPRGNLRIILTSPSGTHSSLLLPRPHDRKADCFDDWPFMSVHFWGEKVTGVWTLTIINDGNMIANAPGNLKEWSIIFYGTKDLPAYMKENGKYKFTAQPEHTHPVRRINYDSFNDDEPSLKDCKLSGKFLAISEEDINYCTHECPINYYGNQKDSTCHRCDMSCAACYGPSYNNCLSCPLKYLLLNSTCVKSCPEGYFADCRSHLHMCIPCALSCVACKGNLKECILCKDEYFLHESHCLAHCPTGTYSKDNMCFKCDYKCESCYGPLQTDCILCSKGFFLWDTKCVSGCPPNHYTDSLRRCVKCHSACESCVGPTSCILCNAGYFKDSSGMCRKYCEDEGNEESLCGQCIRGVATVDGCQDTCPVSTYLLKNECQECFGKCFDCHQNPYNCIICNEGFYLYANSCLADCPSGYFRTRYKTCEQCHTTCKYCFGSFSYNCMSCYPEHYLWNNTCIDICPSGFFASVFEDSKECLPCHPSCRECSEYGPFSCSSCYPNATQNITTCIPCIDGEYYDIKEKVCKKCHENCGACFGPLENQCLSCLSPLRLHEHNRSCLPCCHSSGKITDCCKCTIDLDVCVTNSHSQNMNVSIIPSDNKFYIKNIIMIAVGVSIMIIVIVVILFGILQYRSNGWYQFRAEGKQYMPVPHDMSVNFNTDQEKVALTHEDFEEEDDIFQKI